MRLNATQPLFAWESLEDSPSLDTVRELLAVLPDARLLEALRCRRGHGRDDYPVTVLWGVVVLKAALRHADFEACLGELRRNPALRHLIGIEREEDVPRKWNISRFLKVLGTEPHLRLLREVFDGMIRSLGEVVSDLGTHTAGDSSGLSAQDEARPDPTLPKPSGGRKEYTDESGNVTKVVEWFGYKFHLLVDTRHEVALAWRISSTNRGDNEEIGALVEQARGNLPADRMKTLTYDKAADDEKVHGMLKKTKIKPVILNRSMWKDKEERLLSGHDGRSNVVHDEAGTIFCYDKISEPPVRRRMAYIGHEPSRGTLKYRCPAMHEGWTCASHDLCNAGRKYGKTVRVKQEIDLRRFPPIPRATKQFERLYKERTSVERVNARLKVFWGTDDGNIAGASRFHAHLGVVMVVHAGFATLLASAPRRDGTLGRMRLTTVAKALRQKRAL